VPSARFADPVAAAPPLALPVHYGDYQHMHMSAGQMEMMLSGKPLLQPVPQSEGHRPAHRARIRGTLIALSILLAGCAQVQHMTGSDNCDDPSLSPSRQLLCKDDKTFNKTVVGDALIGGLVGGVTGIAACAAAGKSNLLACGAIGTGVGLFAGGVGGYLVAKKEQAGKENVRAIDAVTDDIRKENVSLTAQVNAAQETLTEDQAALASIRSQVQSGELTADQARAKRAAIAADSAHLAGIIHHEQEQEKNFVDSGKQLNQTTRSYTRQLNDLHDQIASLTAQKDALDQAMSASS